MQNWTWTLRLLSPLYDPIYSQCSLIVLIVSPSVKNCRFNIILEMTQILNFNGREFSRASNLCRYPCVAFGTKMFNMLLAIEVELRDGAGSDI